MRSRTPWLFGLAMLVGGGVACSSSPSHGGGSGGTGGSGGGSSAGNCGTEPVTISVEGTEACSEKTCSLSFSFDFDAAGCESGQTFASSGDCSDAHHLPALTLAMVGGGTLTATGRFTCGAVHWNSTYAPAQTIAITGPTSLTIDVAPP